MGIVFALRNYVNEPILKFNQSSEFEVSGK